MGIGKGNGKGGRRAGAGRPLNSKSTKSIFTVQSYRERFKVLPLDHMMAILNGIDPISGEKVKVSNERRDEMATKAAPYIHPKLTAIVDPHGKAPDLSGRYSVDVTRLSDEELALFERLMLKAGVPMKPADATSNGDNGSVH